MEKSKTIKKTGIKKTASKKTVSKSAADAVKKTALKKTAAKKASGGEKIKTSLKKPASAGIKSAKKTSGAGNSLKKSVSKPKTASKKSQIDPTLEVVVKCRKALDDKKAEDIRVLDVRGKSPITNYFLIASATSEPHMRALASELEKTLKDLGVKAIGREYNTGSGWVVVDGFDFMAHIFLPEQRGLYGIESLWKDSSEILF